MGSAAAKEATEEAESPGDRPRRFHSRSTTDDVLKNIDLTGKTILITGTTSGIGIETAKACAMYGAHVVMANRNLPASQKLRDEIMASKPDAQVDILQIDLSSLATVKTAAEEYLSRGWPLHILILNAGVMGPAIESTVDGLETNFEVNYLSHFYLSQLLMLKLRESAPSRVVVVASTLHAMTNIDPSLPVDEKLKIMIPAAGVKEPKMPLYYAYSKLCSILFSFALHRREHQNGINTYVLHPGTLIGTGIMRDLGGLGTFVNIVARPWVKTLKQGAATTVYCAADPELNSNSGRYFMSCWDDEKYHQVSLTRDEELQDALWNYSVKLLKEKELNKSNGIVEEIKQKGEIEQCGEIEQIGPAPASLQKRRGTILIVRS